MNNNQPTFKEVHAYLQEMWQEHSFNHFFTVQNSVQRGMVSTQVMTLVKFLIDKGIITKEHLK